MTQTTAAREDFTEEQRVEWRTAVDHANDISTQAREARQTAGAMLVWALRSPDDAATARAAADDYAATALALLVEWRTARDAAHELPYGRYMTEKVLREMAERKAAA